MSKVKHFLRKLHIGDHNHHGRPPAMDPSHQAPPPQQLASTSPSSEAPPTASSSSDNEGSSRGNSNSNNNFSFFEEEFQMQLALAISVSDQGQNCVDPETAQINVAKQISLGCAPSQDLSEFMSLRFWVICFPRSCFAFRPLLNFEFYCLCCRLIEDLGFLW